MIKREKMDDGNVQLTYENRTEVHSLTELPLVTFHEKKKIPDVEEINIDTDIPAVINY